MGIFGLGKSTPQPSTVRQPAALPRTQGPAPASPRAAAATPVKSAVPAAGRSSLDPFSDGLQRRSSPVDAVAEVYRQAGCAVEPHRKGGGYEVLPGPASAMPDEVIPAKWSGPVKQPAEKKEEPPVTAALIVEECGKRIRRSTRDSLFIGSLVYRWILKQPERAPDCQFGRNGALEHLREKLLAAKYDEGSCRVDRDLRCYHLVNQLGEAKGLAISAIRHLLPLLEKEQAKERPKLKTAYADAARALWQRMHAEKLTAAAVRIEVLRILPAKPPRDDRRQKSRQAVTVLRLIPMLTAEERREAMRALREADAAAKLRPAAAIAG
jgi:hypothetical protein